MRESYIFTFISILYAVSPTFGSSSIDCNYNKFKFYSVGLKYRCEVSNNPTILSPESAQITSVNGIHETKKSNSDEIYFFSDQKPIQYLPQGLEKFFTNLTGIAIWNSQLKEIHQDALKNYKKLKFISLGSNDIEVIDDGTFDNQPEIEVIRLTFSKIFHIGLTVFDGLLNLTSLNLEQNTCIDMVSTNNRAGVNGVIKRTKITCISSDYQKLDEKLKNLEEKYTKLNQKDFIAFDKEVKQFETDLAVTKISKIRSFKARASFIINWRLYTLWDKIESFQASLNESKAESLKPEADKHERHQIMAHRDEYVANHNNENEVQVYQRRFQFKNFWLMIVAEIVCFNQTVILVIIFELFVNL